MRYELRHNNGVIHVFDTITYRAVDAYQKHQEDAAVRHVERLNKNKNESSTK